MRRLLLIGLLSFVALAAFGGYLAWPRGGTPDTKQAAVADFRSRQPSPTGPQRPSSVRPTAGVYTYSAEGDETVKLGPLPTERRPYPDNLNVVIVHQGEACFTVTLRLLAEHTEESTYCSEGNGELRLDRHEKHQQVGALKPSATMTCDPGVLVASEAGDRSLACTMSLSTGPKQLTATLTGESRNTPDASVVVGKRSVAAIAVDLSYEISGDLTGTWRERTWFAKHDWLPLRIERDLELRGLATFTEHSQLDLIDGRPAG